MQRAPVSVVITTYNRREMVRDAIDSVLAQELPPAQIIVVDDGSKVDTVESLRVYGDRILRHRKQNGGLCSVRNAGIQLATQPIVGFLDDDDVWHPRKLALQMRCMEQHPELGMLGAEQFDWPVPHFPQVLAEDPEPLAMISWEQIVVRTMIPVSSVLVRGDIVKRVGDFDLSLKSSEDRDFFLRVAAVAPVGFLNIPLVGYRDTPGSMCKNPGVREQAMRQILDGLDTRRAWNGRWLLRRKAYGYMHLGCSDVYARAGRHWGAVVRVLKSLASYPMPYRADEVRLRFERPKRLVVNLLRMLHLKGPDAAPETRPIPTTNALALRHDATRSTSPLAPVMTNANVA